MIWTPFWTIFKPTLIYYFTTRTNFLTVSLSFFCPTFLQVFLFSFDVEPADGAAAAVDSFCLSLSDGRFRPNRCADFWSGLILTLKFTIYLIYIWLVNLFFSDWLCKPNFNFYWALVPLAAGISPFTIRTLAFRFLLHLNSRLPSLSPSPSLFPSFALDCGSFFLLRFFWWYLFPLEFLVVCATLCLPLLCFCLFCYTTVFSQHSFSAFLSLLSDRNRFRFCCTLVQKIHCCCPHW